LFNVAFRGLFHTLDVKNESCLAVLSKDLEFVKKHVNAIANIRGAIGPTSLMLAAQNGDLEMCKLLVQAGAQVNAKTAGITALAMAVSNGHTDVVKYLLSVGANTKVVRFDGNSIVDLAKNHPTILALLSKN